MLSTMRHAARPFLAAGARSSAAGAQRQLHDVRHASPHQVRETYFESDQTVTLKLRIGANILPIEAQVGKTLLDAAHRNEVNVDGTCDGDLACSTCHVRIEDPEIYAKADDISKGNEAGLAARELEDDLLLSSFDVNWGSSRLACQVDVTPEMDGMEVRYPGMVDASKLTQTPLGRALERSLAVIEPKKFTNLTKAKITKIFKKHAATNPHLNEKLEEFLTLAAVLPFRTNNYVVEELIDWNNVPEDPIFQLTFPQPGMLPAEWLEEVHKVRMEGGSAAEVRRAADKVRAKMNPHPAKQKEMNVPNHFDEQTQEAEFERGMQHKYRETVLFFPSEAQYCHSYCTYCFRWAQFVGSSDMQFASNAAEELVNYLRGNKDVSDVLFTGGDPMVLNSKQLGKYLDSVASDPTLDHIQTVRIGSKSLAYWPYKYVTDPDADNLLALLERVVKSGKHISLMAHFSHPAELNTPVVKEAIRRLRSTGIQIRCQAPLINHINNDPEIWATMWREQVKQGMVPYYMFIERDTGARHYFAVPLYQAVKVFNGATQKLSGLARTARGPSMSCIPGKVHVLGVETIANEKVFVLKFLQVRPLPPPAQPCPSSRDSHGLAAAVAQSELAEPRLLRAIRRDGDLDGRPQAGFRRGGVLLRPGDRRDGGGVAQGLGLLRPALPARD